jgi:hypothetical protein
MQNLIQQQLARAKNRMKMQADKQRTERYFDVGNWIYVKLQPYVQSSIAPRANQKLSYWFFGPYMITEKIGSVAYKLKLPASSAVHPVFHVSQLKGAIPVSVSAEELPDSLDGLQVPERVLQKRVAKHGMVVRLQALIQWAGLPRSMATWEDLEPLRQRFPRAPAWGQPGTAQRGMSASLYQRHQQLKTKAAPLMGLGGKDANAGPMYDSRAQSGREDHELALSTKRV